MHACTGERHSSVRQECLPSRQLCRTCSDACMRAPADGKHGVVGTVVEHHIGSLAAGALDQQPLGELERHLCDGSAQRSALSCAPACRGTRAMQHACVHTLACDVLCVPGSSCTTSPSAAASSASARLANSSSPLLAGGGAGNVGAGRPSQAVAGSAGRTRSVRPEKPSSLPVAAACMQISSSRSRCRLWCCLACASECVPCEHAWHYCLPACSGQHYSRVQSAAGGGGRRHQIRGMRVGVALLRMQLRRPACEHTT